ncbi:MAG: hypothetical protein KAH68_07720 [Draconibacterium sp.]|nr:hypothetical protein [Draconibacterium sp.]
MEKTLDLKIPGVQELGKEELRGADGGGILLGIATLLGGALLAGATWEIITSSSAECWEDFTEGYESVRN